MTLNQLTMINLAPRGIRGTCVPTSLSFVTGTCYQDIEYVLVSEQPNTYRPDIQGNRGVYTDKLLGTSRILFGHRFTQVHTPNRDLRLRDVPHMFSVGTYLVQIPRHVLVVKDGQFFDLCQSNPKSGVGFIWKVEKLS